MPVTARGRASVSHKIRTVTNSDHPVILLTPRAVKVIRGRAKAAMIVAIRKKGDFKISSLCKTGMSYNIYR